MNSQPVLGQILVRAFVAQLALALALLAQAPPQAPYASMDRNAVTYRGPELDPSVDLSGDVITLGLLLSLEGNNATEGKLLRQAAELALHDEQELGPFSGGRHLTLAVRNESERWGQASNEMVQLITEQRVAALITEFNGDIAHQAEQLANKLNVPVLTLSSDSTTTQANIPWIFRFGPSDADQARIIAEHLYRQTARPKVLLIAENDHDGRSGAAEFARATEHLGAPPPARLEVSPSAGTLEWLLPRISEMNPDSVVLWTGSDLASRVVATFRRSTPTLSVYLSRKAAQSMTIPENAGSRRALPTLDTQAPGIWTVTTAHALDPNRQSFRASYLEQTGLQPSLAALQTYDAVRLLAAAVRIAGANRVRLRDVLASPPRPGSSPAHSFDSAGNVLAESVLVPLPAAVASSAAGN